MLSVIGFLVILGPLVVFHELGHYFFARLFNVKAEIFSIGFGPRLWSKQKGETEWRVSLIPLGGYVKLLGEDRESELSPQELSRALHKQAAWKRFFIFFGGPLFNFILAAVVFMLIMVIGEPQVASVVGRAVTGSAAEKAGFHAGQTIVAIDGQPVRLFEEVAQAIHTKPRQAMEFEVRDAGATTTRKLVATPDVQSGFSVYGEETNVGEIEGLLPTARAGIVGVSDPRSLAGQAGIATSDLLTHVDGQEVANWEVFLDQYAAAPAGKTFDLTFARGAETGRKAKLNKPANARGPEMDWGLASSELFVEKAVPKSPAEQAGILHGDRLTAVAGTEVHSFFELKDLIQKSGEKGGKIQIQGERAGKPFNFELVPTATEGRDPTLKKTMQFTIGIMPMLTMAEPPTIVERVLNPITLFYKGTVRMVTFSWRNLVSVVKMVTGDVSVGTLGGPILIGKIAGESLSRGVIAFLTTMAVLSIGLGVLNILPVPVLDGGHLLLLGIEMIRGKPMSMKQMEMIQGVGLILILGLMGLVIHNDLSRLSSF